MKFMTLIRQNLFILCVCVCVLCKGLNFAVKPKSIDYSEFLLPFELLFRDLKHEKLVQGGFVFNES